MDRFIRTSAFFQLQVKYLNSTQQVEANPDPDASSSCSADEITYLHIQCLKRKVLAPLIDPDSVTSKAANSTQYFYREDGFQVYPCPWVNATSMSDEIKSDVSLAIGCETYYQ